MTRVIKLSGDDGGERRVRENVNNVAIEINRAQSRNERFVQLTHAESGKEIAVDPARVTDEFEKYPTGRSVGRGSLAQASTSRDR
jgi:hypothetical protein